MNYILQCTKCKIALKNNLCPKCNQNFFNNDDGFFNFTDNKLIFHNNSDFFLSNLLSEINIHGYSKALLDFIKINPKLEYRFDKREGNIAFRTLTQKNNRCLVINSDLGNIPEVLSQMFNEVYSLDVDEKRILIQKYRFQEKNISNIILIKSDVENLPFSSDYFDLVVSYGIKINNKNNASKITLLKYFTEIKRVLTVDGCLCAGLGNKYGLKKYAHQIGYDINDETHSCTFSGYNSILNSIGFQVKPYWVLPSYKKIHYSGNINDTVSLKWFFRNLDVFLIINTKFGIEKLLKKSNNFFSKLIMKFFSPSFLFYCYKKNIPKTFEGFVVEKTGFENIIQLVRPRKIIYILFDKFGVPKKKIFCKIIKYNLTEKIFPLERTLSNMEDPDEKIIIDNWVNGDILDPYNKDDVHLLMKWLIDFQNNTKSESITIQEIEEEIQDLKNDFNIMQEMSDLSYNEWLDEYKNHIIGLNLKKTAVHHNLRPNHIYVNHTDSIINVIDWEDFEKKGNPFFDFMWFAITVMTWSNDDVKEFSSNLKETGNAAHTIKIIKEYMNNHFQTDLDFIILLRFFILKWISFKIKRGSKIDFVYISLLKTLSENF
jgi:ubiquinone/menaquinone biosynthesis C-methylase UbiE